MGKYSDLVLSEPTTITPSSSKKKSYSSMLLDSEPKDIKQEKPKAVRDEFQQEIEKSANLPGFTQEYGRSLGRGLTFGLYDRAGAAYDTAIDSAMHAIKGPDDIEPQSLIESYEHNLNDRLDRRDKFHREAPAAAISAEVAGSLPAGGAIGKGVQVGAHAPGVIGAVASTVKNAATANPTTALVASGAGAGALYGGAQARPGEVAEDATTGGIYGGIFGAAFPAVGLVFKKSAKLGNELVSMMSTLKPAASKARTVLKAQMDVVGTTFDDVARKMKDRFQGNGMLINMMDDADGALLHELDRITNTNSKARAIVRKAINTQKTKFNKTSFDRMEDQLKQSLGVRVKEGDKPIYQAFAEKRKVTANKGFKAAYRQDVDKYLSPNDKMMIEEVYDTIKMLDRRTYNDAKKLAAAQTKQMGQEVGVNFRDMHSMIRSLRDGVTRFYREGSGGKAAELKEQMGRLREFANKNPHFKSAMQKYADNMSLENAYKDGLKVFSDDADDMIFKLSERSQDELKMFKEGVFKSVRRKLARRAKESNNSATIFDNVDVKEHLEPLMSKDELQKFMNAVDDEFTMKRLENITMGGSPTARREISGPIASDISKSDGVFDYARRKVSNVMGNMEEYEVEFAKLMTKQGGDLKDFVLSNTNKLSKSQIGRGLNRARSGLQGLAQDAENASGRLAIPAGISVGTVAGSNAIQPQRNELLEALKRYGGGYLSPGQ